MPRRQYKSINVTKELADTIDCIVKEQRPFGISSRDEFLRAAATILCAAVIDPKTGKVPLDVINDILQRFQKQGPEP